MLSFKQSGNGVVFVCFHSTNGVVDKVPYTLHLQIHNDIDDINNASNDNTASQVEKVLISDSTRDKEVDVTHHNELKKHEEG